MNLPRLFSKNTRQEETGRARMQNLSVAICCLARDAEDGLQRNIPAINQLRALFKSSRVIVVENDSKDRTKELLAEWAKKDAGVSVLSKDTGTQTIPHKTASGAIPAFSLHRIGKMVSFRNQYLEEVEKGDRPDILIAIDIDVDSFSIAGICHSFGAAQPWDALFANGKDRDVFYDVYALRKAGDSGPKNMGEMNQNQIRFSGFFPGHPLVPVACAFGGLGIYRYAALAGLRYRPLANEQGNCIESLVDHESLHRDMRDRGYGKLFINPSLTVTYNPRQTNREEQKTFDFIVLNQTQFEPMALRLRFFTRLLLRYGPSVNLGRFAITHLLLAPASLEDAIGRRKVKSIAGICALLALAGTVWLLKIHGMTLASIAGMSAALMVYPVAILTLRTLVRLTITKKKVAPAPASP